MPLDQKIKKPSEIRAELLDLVLADLMGPKGGPEEEVAERRITDRYILGRLAPKEVRIQAEQIDSDIDSFESGGSDDDSEPESAAHLQTSLFQSSIGMSFIVDAAAGRFSAKADWGQYIGARSEYHESEAGDRATVWKRTQVTSPVQTIELKEGPIELFAPAPDFPEVTFSGKIRKSHERYYTVSLFLRNDSITFRKKQGEDWLFQVSFEVFDEAGKAIFISRNQVSHGLNKTEEEKTQDVIYRNHHEFAAGHGIAVAATPSDSDPGRAVRLKTVFAPVTELPYTVLGPADSLSKNLILDMKVLSELQPDELLQSLQTLPDEYIKWISLQSEKAGEIGEHASVILDHCRNVQKRMVEGIEILKNHSVALEAFQFANEAMYLQRIHSLYSEAKLSKKKVHLEDFDTPENRSWRLFQLGFFLINIPALSDPHHHDRSTDSSAIADLLWFPTGGGKTEAYLGLTAYSLAMRRFQGEQNGVAVFMRYTLRLLTLQQFQRSAALICACEEIRKRRIAAGNTRLGNVPFRIGLWVGQRTTPNKTDQSDEALKRHRGNTSNFSYSGSPYQITNCPWCGSEIQPGNNNHMVVENYSSGRGRTFVYCGDSTGQCAFSPAKAKDEGIPIVVVDEEIYRLLPSLVIGTVDKLAQMTWQGPVQMLFGKVNSYCPRHGFGSPDLRCPQSHNKKGSFPAVKTEMRGPIRPPDLIIQDELHLISGPLGTLVGLYETVVDELCKWEHNGKIVRPKVIASTATIRMAEQQIHAVFDRKANVFPPPGLDITDNFFSHQISPSDQHPGRLYLGVNAVGERVKMILIRVYMAFLAAAKKLHNEYGDTADPYMTLVGYFNSIRELGGMRRLVEDDISTRLYRMDNRGLARRKRPHIEELTSRKNATDIPAILTHLEKKHKIEPVEHLDKNDLDIKPKIRSYEKPAIDVLLATNMISVGVDVKRFGLMVVAGQPKTTSEYIQATSRIGRSAPGIVCTVYNWTRPRDISHYERFEHYHQTFYKQVEANSVTPFSARAIDRGLNGILVGLIRMVGTELNPNESAHNLASHPGLIDKIRDVIVTRAGRIDPNSVSNINEMIDTAIKTWQAAASGVNTLTYKHSKGDTTNLIMSFGHQNTRQHLPCLNSLREVEVPASLVITDFRARVED